MVQSTERKEAAVCPTSAQVVIPVKLLRDTRTAWVMLELQEETQDVDRPGNLSI